MVFPSELSVPVMRGENSGASLHIFHTPPSQLICKLLETPRSSEASMQHVPAESSWPLTPQTAGNATGLPITTPEQQCPFHQPCGGGRWACSFMFLLLVSTR